MGEGEIHGLASLLNCRVMKVPFTYLGLPVGGNPRRISFWDTVVKKMSGRLTQWRKKVVSFGGRLTLISSVLSSIPLFYLSFFNMPQGVINKCRRIMRSFLWGGKEDRRSVAWVSWEVICKPKELGGLGLRDWESFNQALLGK